MTTTLMPNQEKTINQRIHQAIAKARAASNEHDTMLAAVYWDEAEELLAEASHQQSKPANQFQVYCAENPDADECRIYDV